jgi:biopolymer transport protein ExbD
MGQQHGAVSPKRPFDRSVPWTSLSTRFTGDPGGLFLIAFKTSRWRLTGHESTTEGIMTQRNLPQQKQETRDPGDAQIHILDINRQGNLTIVQNKEQSPLKRSRCCISSQKISMVSSSNPGLSLEARLLEMKKELDNLKKQVQEQHRYLLYVDKKGELNWEQINEDLAKLREDFDGAKDAGEEYTQETEANFKDQANTNGDFGNRICTLEIKVKRLAKMLPAPRNDED